MQKKIIFGFLGVLVGIFLIAFMYTAYIYYEALHSDKRVNPTFTLSTGEATIVREKLAIDLSAGETTPLLEGDTIFTKNNSIGRILWPDHSLTALGNNSTLKIDKMQVSEDYNSIDIEMGLLSGQLYTKVVRTIYPGSKFLLTIPSKGVSAGVRGTEYGVNLDKNYLHSIDHAIEVQNSIFQKVFTLPGEAISLSNIFEKVSQNLLDTSWETNARALISQYWNAYVDQISKDISSLKNMVTSNSLWQKFMRTMLSYIYGFRELNIFTKLQSHDVTKIEGIPLEDLTLWYQRMKIGEFPKERDVIRGAVSMLSKADASVQKLLGTLLSDSLWDKLQFPKENLNYSDIILKDYSKELGANITTILNALQTHDYGKDVGASFQKLYSEGMSSIGK